MVDIYKVIKGLEVCMSKDKTCSDCPYEGTVCITTLSTDALELLRDHPQIVRCRNCEHWDFYKHECDKKEVWFACPDLFCADRIRKDMFLSGGDNNVSD